MKLIIKINNIYLLAVILLMLCSVSCVNDYFSSEDCEPDIPYSEDAQTFMLIRVKNTSEEATRADDKFIDGSHDEHGVGPSGNYAIFFNANKEYVNMVSLFPVDLSHSESPEDDETKNVSEGVYRAPLYHVSEADYNKFWENKKDDDILGYCLIVLNGKAVNGKLSTAATLGRGIDGIVWEESDDLTTPIGTSVQAGNDDEKTRYFTMTNTAYIVNNQVQVATPFKVEALQLTKYNDYDWSKAITVYVERMVAKVTLEVKDAGRTSGYHSEVSVNKEGDKIKSYIFTPVNPKNQNPQINVCTGWNEHHDPVTEDRDWRVEITGWNMNAIQRQEFIFKNINQTGYSSFFTNWNTPADRFRTYWAEDPYYGSKDYPWQFREAVNIPDDVYQSGWSASAKQVPDYSTKYGNGNDNTNVLRNFSYSELNNSVFEKAVYIPEHTYNQGTDGLTSTSLDGRRDLLAGTHLIMPAFLQVADRNGENFKADDYYRDAADIWYGSAKDCVWALVRYINNSLTSLSRLKFRQFDRTGQSNGMILYGVPEAQNGDNKYQLYYDGSQLTFERIMAMDEEECKSLLAPATIKDGDGKRILQSDKFTIQNEKGDHLPIYALYTLGEDETPDSRWDNSGFRLGTSALRKTLTREKYIELQNLAAGNGEQDANKRAQIEALIRTLSQEVTTQSANDVWSLILEWCGAVDHFNGGRMYYASPLKTDETEDVFGAVRNTWYKYQITDLIGIGIPVDEPEQPIVPNWDRNKTARLNLRIGICSWEEKTINIPDFK